MADMAPVELWLTGFVQTYPLELMLEKQFRCLKRGVQRYQCGTGGNKAGLTKTCALLEQQLEARWGMSCLQQECTGLAPASLTL